MSDSADALRFTHFAPGASGTEDAEDAETATGGGGLTRLPAGPTDTLRQTFKEERECCMICADTPMVRGTQYAEFTLRGGAEASKVRELFEFVDTNHDGALTKLELPSSDVDVVVFGAPVDKGSGGVAKRLRTLASALEDLGAIAPRSLELSLIHI